MIKYFKKLPGGLVGRLMKLMVTLILALGILFATMSGILMVIQKSQVKYEEVERTQYVETEFKTFITDFSKDILLQLVTWSADAIDDAFWALDCDFEILRAQVEDVFNNPENYARVQVQPPLEENNGKFSLQLLYPDDMGEVDDEAMEMIERLANLAPMMESIVSRNNYIILDCYISTPCGLTLAMDNSSGKKFDESGTVRTYDPRTRPWYRGAAELGDTFFSSRVHGYFYETDIVEFGIPCYKDGELVAVLQGSCGLDVIDQKLEMSNIRDDSFSVVIGSDGQILRSRRTEGELKVNENQEQEIDIRESVNPGLCEVINLALEGNIDVRDVMVDGETCYVGYVQLTTCGWVILTFFPEKDLTGPADNLTEMMNESTSTLLEKLDEDLLATGIMLVVFVIAIIWAAISMSSKYAKKWTSPLDKMTQAVRNFVGDEMEFEMEDMYRTGDEIQVLAEAFDSMSGKMKEYVREIVEHTAERERTATEMEMASKIQLKMLPDRDTVLRDDPEYELYTRMVPATEVGGDFYDFFYLDDDHLVLTVGDVSGKGITGALFMALCKQMFRSQMILQSGDVVKAVTESNIRLCEESADSMFVTVWMGVLTISTGELSFVDAGHEYAAVKRNDGQFTLEEDNHSMFVGGVDFADYKLNTIKLNAGEIIYLYTDGVTEARNLDMELFGEERFTDALNEAKDLSVEEIDNHVRSKIAGFTAGAEQFDDMTTLCFRYLGTGEKA